MDSYSQATANGKKTMIFSTSITRDIKPNEFNERYKGGRTAKFIRFHGGKARHITTYLPVHLREQHPDTVVLAEGGNDLPTEKCDPAAVAEVAGHILEAARVCKNHNVSNVYVSSVLPRSSPYFQINRRKLNSILKKECEENGFIFIDNDTIVNDRTKEIILREHVCWDGVHLNRAGSDILRDNFLYYLKHH